MLFCYLLLCYFLLFFDQNLAIIRKTLYLCIQVLPMAVARALLACRSIMSFRSSKNWKDARNSP